MENLTLKTKYPTFTGSSPYESFLAKRSGSGAKPAAVATETNYYSMKRAEFDKPKGRLVKGPLIPNPFTEAHQGVKNFLKATRGEGTDYSVGRINDPAIAIGAGAIATVLAAATKDPRLKAMEFVGAGAFLTAMSVWPKLFLAKPVKAMTGVDLNLEYINAQNERKPYMMDPQYIPWDLMDKKQLEEAGRKLNVPEGIDNRDEEIQRRMRKVSTGVNAWWMLSAGFSTPLMASLIANRLETPVEGLINKTRFNLALSRLEAAGIDTGSKGPVVKLGSKLVKILDMVRDKSSGRQRKALETLLEKGDGKAIQKFFKDLTGSKEVRAYLLPGVGDALETPGSAGKNAVMAIYDDFNRLNVAEKALRKYTAAADSVWGTGRRKIIEGFVQKLGIKGKDLKKLSETTGRIAGNTEIITGAVQKAAKDGRLEEVAKGMEDLTQKPLARVVENFEAVPRYAGQIMEKMKGSKLGEVAEMVLSPAAENALDKATGARASVSGIPNIVRQGGKDVDVIMGIDGQKLWNRLKILDNDGIRDLTGNIFGRKNPVVKAIANFLESNPDDKEKLAVRMHTILGENPPDMLSRAAESLQGRTGWLKKVGLVSAAVVGATAVALLLITKNAKKNEQNKRVSA